jgi:hypothetical protein
MEFLGKSSGKNKLKLEQKPLNLKPKSRVEVQADFWETYRVALRRQGRQFESDHPDIKPHSNVGLFCCYQALYFWHGFLKHK